MSDVPPLFNEADLITRAAAGDTPSFMTLVRHYDGALRSVVFSIVNDRDDMDDVLQEAYFKAYRSLAKFERRSRFGTWIYRIAYNAAIDFTRRRKRTTGINDEMLDDLVAPESTSVEVREDLCAALKSLGPEHRATIWLVDVNGVDQATAASILGVPVGTVSSRLVNGRARLRAALGAGYREEER